MTTIILTGITCLTIYTLIASLIGKRLKVLRKQYARPEQHEGESNWTPEGSWQGAFIDHHTGSNA